MEQLIVLFEDIGTACQVTLDDTQSPNTVAALKKVLPIRVAFNPWGKELYSNPLPIRFKEEGAHGSVPLGAAAIWPPGSALCLFLGKTPIGAENEIRPASPVNIIGRVVEPWPEDLIKNLGMTSMAMVRIA